jgi:hypothetical protein
MKRRKLYPLLHMRQKVNINHNGEDVIISVEGCRQECPTFGGISYKWPRGFAMTHFPSGAEVMDPELRKKVENKLNS